MNILVNILAAVVVLGGLVMFHEYGHFWAARRCGVRVLTFSIGFGRPLWVREDRHGTRFAISMLPLGGYVRLHDRNKAPAVASEHSDAFEDQPLWARAFIMLAGPLANFLLAIVVFWGLFMYGVSGVAPIIGDVTPDSPAATAGFSSGQEITAIDHQSASTWQQVDTLLRARSGLVDIETGAGQHHRMSVDRISPTEPVWTSLGLAPWQPAVAPVLGQVKEDAPAALAGLFVGDRIVRMNGQPVGSWQAVVSHVRAADAGQGIQLEVERVDGTHNTLTLMPIIHTLPGGQQVNYIGAGAKAPEWPAGYMRTVRLGPVAAVGASIERTWQLSVTTVAAIGKMVTGALSPRNLSGPIMIGKVAGDTARSGVEAFVTFLAYLSISLGILNLLPVPMLDGGHLLYFAFEAIRRRPLSEKVQIWGRCIGMILIGTLMIAAFYFDLTRV